MKIASQKIKSRHNTVQGVCQFLLSGSHTLWRFIPLTQGKFAIVDAKNYEWLNQWKWRCEKHGRTFRAVRTAYPPETTNKKTVLMHRQIMKGKPGQEIDHSNGNDLDNRIDNLRFCNRNQNCGNARKQRNCSSQYKGVSWCKRTGKWLAQITYNYKNHNLGYFDNESEAAKVYDTKALELFGEFAYTNF